MSTDTSLYQLRRQKARYDLPEAQPRRVVLLCLPLPQALPRDVGALLVVTCAIIAALLVLICCACDIAVGVAQQAYGVTL